MSASLRNLTVMFFLSATITLGFQSYLIITNLPTGSQNEPLKNIPEKEIQFSVDDFQKISQASGVKITLTDIRAVSQKEMHCLAKNIYHEARGENLVGMLGVAQITLNRADSNYRGKNTLCGVVHDPGQFSWVNSKKHIRLNGASWQQSIHVAQIALLGIRIEELENSLYFHSRKINKPEWSKQLPVNTKIGNHIYM